MHRKTVVETVARRCNEHSLSKSARGTFVAALRYGCICVLSALPLAAGPDPDLFDGRRSPLHSKEEQSATGLPESGRVGERSGRDGSGDQSEPRELESVGGSGGGDTVQSNSSKTGDRGNGGRPSGTPPDSSTETPASGGGSSASTTSGQGGTASGGGAGDRPTTGSPNSQTGGSGSQEPRSFEDFGFGGAGSAKKIEINRSKDSGQSSQTSGRASNGSDGPTSSSSTCAGQEATSGSQPTPDSASGDYGTNLPSGL